MKTAGNITHRFLDGHPQMFVYPFESQIGTRMVMDHLSSMFPVKYRWPVFALDATPAEDYQGNHRRRGKVRARTPNVSKFRHMPFDFSDDERAAIYEQLHQSRQWPLARATMSRHSFARRSTLGKIINRTGEEVVMLATARSLLWMRTRFCETFPGPRSARVRNPWSAYADTKKRPVPLSLAHYMLGWTLNQYHALLLKESYPDRMHIVRAEDVMADSLKTLGAVCEALGLESAESLKAPTWNGAALEEVYPWGTIRKATPEANRATAGELSSRERDEIRSRTWQYLEVFDYKGFLPG